MGPAAPSPTNAMPAPGGMTPPAAPPVPDGGDELEQYVRHCFQAPGMANLYAKYGMGEGAPMGDPAAPLGADMPPPPPPGAPPDQAAQAFQRQVQWLTAQLYAREREIRLGARRNDLSTLEGQGFLFDLEQELEDAADMPAVQYARHITRIKERYSRDPAAGEVVQTIDDAELDDNMAAAGARPTGQPGKPRMVENGGLTMAGTRDIQRYQRENNLMGQPFEVVREKYIREQTNGRKNGRA